MKTISTKYLAPTNTQSARIVASDGDNRKIVAWDDAKNIDDNHKAAIEAFCQKVNWYGVLALGHTKDGMVAVFLEHRSGSRKSSIFQMAGGGDAILLIV